MSYWPFTSLRSPCSSTEALELQSKMADQVMFAKRVRKSLYYGEYSDASLPSLSVTDVAVEVLNNTVPSRKRLLDRKYAHSVARRAKISPCTLIMGMLYAERLHQRNPQSTMTLNSSDVFLISIMVASKYLYDEGEEEEVYNEDWARAGCKTVQDINKLEMDFLQLIDWNLFISKGEFLNFVNQVESKVALNKGCARGWLTYSDMCTLLNNNALLDLLQVIQQQLLTNISKCLTAYLFGVSILLGSSALASLIHNPSQQDTIFHGTPVQPSFNCLTTEASCFFSRKSIEVAPPGLDLVIRPIAQRRKRVPGSSLQRQGFQNVTSSKEQKMDAREVIQSPSENQSFPGSIDISSLFGILGNFTSQNLNLKRRLVTYDCYANCTDRKLSVQSWSSLCVQKMNESTRNVGSFEPQSVNEGYFEKFPENCVSSTEWNCYYRKQLCVS